MGIDSRPHKKGDTLTRTPAIRFIRIPRWSSKLDVKASSRPLDAFLLLDDKNVVQAHNLAS